MLLEF